jgi:hypothetical protein
MAFENTTTEQDMDANTRQFVQSIKVDSVQDDPDLDIDGLSESLLARIAGLFSSSKP